MKLLFLFFFIVPVVSYYKSFNVSQNSVISSSSLSFNTPDEEVQLEFYGGNYHQLSGVTITLDGSNEKSLLLNGVGNVVFNNVTLNLVNWKQVQVRGIKFQVPAAGGLFLLAYLSLSADVCVVDSNVFGPTFGINLKIDACKQAFVRNNIWTPTVLYVPQIITSPIRATGTGNDDLNLFNNTIINRYGNQTGPLVDIIGPYRNVLADSIYIYNTTSRFEIPLSFTGNIQNITVINSHFYNVTAPLTFIGLATAYIPYFQVSNCRFDSGYVAVYFAPNTGVIVLKTRMFNNTFSNVYFPISMGGSDLRDFVVEDSTLIAPKILSNFTNWCRTITNGPASVDITFRNLISPCPLGYFIGYSNAKISIINCNVTLVETGTNVIGVDPFNGVVDMYIIGSSFKGAVPLCGGILHVSGEGSMEIVNSLFDGFERAIFSNVSNLVINGSTFSNLGTPSLTLSPSVWAVGGNRVVVSNSIFTKISGYVATGVRFDSSGLLEVYNCSFTDCSGAGALYFTNAKVVNSYFARLTDLRYPSLSYVIYNTDAVNASLIAINNTMDGSGEQVQSFLNPDQNTISINFINCNFLGGSIVIRLNRALINLRMENVQIVGTFGLKQEVTDGSASLAEWRSVEIIDSTLQFFPNLWSVASLKSLSLENCNVTQGVVGDVAFPLLETLRLRKIYGPSVFTFPRNLNQMTSISTLDLAFNSFNGSYPSLVILKDLASLDLSGNSYTGDFPSTFNVSKLISLKLDLNCPNSPLDLLKTFPSLITLSLSSCNLTYPLSSFQDSSFPLADLNLSNNTISGTLFALSSIKSLNISRTQINGNLVFWEGLSDIDVSDNTINGSLPEAVSTLVSLRASNTSLNGNIPSSYSNHPLLTSLDLSFNSFDGSTLPSFEESKLVYCDFHNSFINCPLRSDLGVCSDSATCPLSTLVTFFEIRVEGDIATFDTEDLRSKLSKLMGISENRLVQISIRSGSVIVGYNITGPTSYTEPDSATALEVLLSLDPTVFKSAGIAFLGISREPNVLGRESSTSLVSSPPKSGMNLPLIIGVAAGGGVLLIIIIVVVVIVIKTKKGNANSVPFPIEMEKPREGSDVYSNIQMKGKENTSYSELELTPNTVRQNSPELQMIEKLGEGAYGIVWKGIYRGQVVAIKQMKTEGLSIAAVEDFLAEADLMKQLKPHDNVVGYVGMNTRPLALITEFMKGGDLKAYLKMTPQLNLQQRIVILKQVADGMGYLAKEKLIHKDLAARNVLMDERATCKVSDFGMSRMVMAEAGSHTSISNVGPIKWMAPESLTKRSYSEKSDVWSWGVLAIEVFSSGEDPFPDLSHMEFAVSALKLHDEMMSQIPTLTLPLELTDLLKEVFSKDPEQRPTFANVSQRIRKL